MSTRFQDLDEVWNGLDAGLCTKKQEGPFNCAPMVDRRVSKFEQEEDLSEGHRWLGWLLIASVLTVISIAAGWIGGSL